MKTVFGIDDIEKDDNTVLTIGTFDGVHIGHREILHKLTQNAEELNCRSVVATFEPHPRKVVGGRGEVPILTVLDEKREIMNDLGIDVLLVIKFTPEFSRQSPEEFFKNYVLDKIGLRKIIIGYDHKFGKGRHGDIEMLEELSRQYNFDVEQCDAVKVEPGRVSSSEIRKLIQNGDVKTANELLGRFYSFSGRVVDGDKRGSRIGYPTANIIIADPAKLIPPTGVYTVRVVIDKQKYFGMMNIGIRPTFIEDGNEIVEVNIFDFNEDIYGKKLKVEVIERIRGEKKFDSSDELIARIKKDKEESLGIISKMGL